MNRKRLIQLLSILILLCISAFLLASTDTEKSNIIQLSTAFVFISGVLVYLCNLSLNISLNKLLPWKKYTRSRLIVHMIFGTMTSLLVMNAVYQFLKISFTDAPPIWEQLGLVNLLGTGLLIPIYAIYFGHKFSQAWRKSELESEVLQKESARTQLLSLRNHLDPHFLFNNLNTLSSLMNIDIELSKSYLDKFAEVYRSILRTRQTDLTTVEEELRMIDSYIYLLKIRFADAVDFNISVTDDDRQKAIPPLSIQMLIENVLKHNIASKSKPILISISSNSRGSIIISNNLQPKIIEPQKTIGSGINNIKSRYDFYSDQAVLIEQTDSEYAVHLPLLEIEEMN